MSHQFWSTGPSSVAEQVTSLATTQASAVVERDSSGDAHANVWYGDKGLRSAGHFYLFAVAKSASFTVDENANNGTVYLVTTGASTITVTLPAANTCTGKVLWVKKVDSGVGTVVFDPDASETIDGSLSYALFRQWDQVGIQSDGTGWNVISGGSKALAVAVAASTAVSNTITETTFDTSGVSIPANTLKAGDVIEVEAWVRHTAQNSTDTSTIKLKLGASTVIVSTGALDVAVDDLAYIKATLTVRTIGASGTLVATGIAAIGTGGTTGAIGALTAKPFWLASVTIDTTAALTVNVTETWSVANAGNSSRLDSFVVRKL